MVRRFDCRHPQLRASDVQLAAASARRGDLVVFPTETAYAVACDAFAPGAVERLRQAKGSVGSGAVPVMVGSVRGFDALAAQVTPEEKAFVAGFWPGPLTVVCKAQLSLQWDVAPAGRPVALRMPLHPVALEVLQAVGPMAVLTANRAGEAAPVDCDQAVEQLGDSVSAYLDAGPCDPGPPSSIVDLTQTEPRLLRVGALDEATLLAALPSLVLADEEP